MAEAADYLFNDDDVIEPELYGRFGHPHRAFRWLRAHDPLRYVRPTKFRPFWAVTRHADIVEIEKQPEVFASAPRPLLQPEATQPEMRQELMAEIFRRLQDSPRLLEVLATAGEGGLIRSLVQMDPPDHPKYRALVQPWFKPSNIKRLEDRLDAIIAAKLDELAGDGKAREVDFVQDVAVWPPLKLIAELLGIPPEDEWRILKLTNELFAGEDAEMRRIGDDPLSIFETIKDLYDYFTRLTQARRAEPGEDLASYIANGRIDGEYLPYKELISYYIIVATAGHETTRTAISVFDDPFAFRIDRKPNRHLAFGTGPHQCLGLLLARLEMRIFFTQLVPRLEHIELADAPAHLRASFVHGLKHLPIRVRLRCG